MDKEVSKALKFHVGDYKPRVDKVIGDREGALRDRYSKIVAGNEARLKPGDSASVFRILGRILKTEGPELGQSPENWIEHLIEKGLLKDHLRYEAIDALGVKGVTEIPPVEMDKRLLAAIELRKSTWGKAQMAEARKIYELHKQSPLAHPLQVMDWIDEQVKLGLIPAEESGSYSDIADVLVWDATHM